MSTTVDPSLPRHLAALAAATDLDGLRIALLGVEDPQRASVHRFLAERAGTPLPGGGRHPLPGVSRVLTVDSMLAVTVLGPSEAARVMEYRRWAWSPEELDTFVRVLAGRGTAWVGRFVTAVGKRRISGRRGDDPATFVRVVDAVCDRFDLPRPVAHRDYVQGWVQQQPGGDGPRTAWRTDPCVPAIVPAALGTFGIHRVPDLPGALAGLVEDGVLTRAELVRVLLDHLLAPGRSVTQRAQLEALQGLGLTAADLGGFPVTLTLVATCHGRVAVPLLPLALELAGDAADLVALAGAVAGRPEKGLRTDLVSALTADDLVQRLGVPASVDALRALREGEGDAAFAATTDRALRRLGATTSAGTTGPSSTGVWDLDPPAVPRRVPAPVPDVRGATEALVRAVLDGTRDPDPAHPEPWHPSWTAVEDALGLLVRWGYAAGADAVREALTGRGQESAHASVLLEALATWGRGALRPDRLDTWVQGAASVPVGRYHGGSRWLADPRWSTLRFLLAVETLLRLGRDLPVLLSEPGPDGSVSFEDLRDRIRACEGGAGYGPLDLFCALLRLGPVHPDRLDELRGTALRADPRVCGGTAAAQDLPDAAQVVGDWVRSGGLGTGTDLAADAHGYPHLARWHPTQVELPPPARRLRTVPPFLLRVDDRWPATHETAPVLAMLPWHPDLALVHGAFTYQRRPDRDPGFLTWARDAPGPLGVVTHEHLLALMESPQPEVREAGARHALALLARDRLDPDALVTAARIRLDRGELALARFSRTWEQVALDGGLRGTWTATLTIAAEAASRSPRPQGLADLLRVLAAAAHEVPEPVLPQPVLDLAAAKGSTKAHQEARVLVAACAAGRA